MGLLSSWIYTNSTRKNRVVKIVHPGGHAELHDRPIIASDILRRNPNCCVAHPNVFHQPWAIVPPNTMLMPGQKFFVVPISTIRKLQKISLKYHPYLAHQNSQLQEEQDDRIDVVKNDAKVKGLKNYTCLKCFVITGFMTNPSDEDSRSSSCSFGSSDAAEPKTRRLVAGFIRRKRGGYPKKHAPSLDNWEPKLQSIIEESGER